MIYCVCMCVDGVDVDNDDGDDFKKKNHDSYDEIVL